MENYYLNYFKALRVGEGTTVCDVTGFNPQSSGLRLAFAREYAFSVPTEEALAKIALFSKKIIESGAATGYWAALLANNYDCSMLCFDIRSGDEYRSIGSWYSVRQRDDVPGILRTFNPEAALMMAWPPHLLPMAYDHLKAFRGDKFIHIGEGYNGASGDQAFWTELTEHWTCVETIPLPQYPAINDSVQLYRRNS